MNPDMSSEIDTIWTMDDLRSVWHHLLPQVNPFAQVLSIPGSIYRAMDSGAKRVIAQSFMNQVKESVMYCIDGTGQDRVFLGAPRHFVARGGMILRPGGSEPFWVLRADDKPRQSISAPPNSEKDAKIPRPPNAYILYRKERHNMVKEANPGITNNEISQVLGRAWNVESREVRQKYKDMAERVKQALLEKHPGYQYRPRKPSEKKRRTKRNAQTKGKLSTGSVEFPVSSPESLGALVNTPSESNETV